MIVPAERVHFALITPDDWDGNPRDVAAALEELASRITTDEAKLPSSSTDHAIARFDGTAGKIQNSGITVSDSDVLDTAGAVETPLLRGHEPAAGPGGSLTVRGGNAQDAGSGGDVLIEGGSKIGIGSDGVVKLLDAGSNEKLRVYSAGVLLYDDLYCAGHSLQSIGNFTTKGDLLSATAASTPQRLGVGSDDQALHADSGESTGLIWKNTRALVTFAYTRNNVATRAWQWLKIPWDYGSQSRHVIPWDATLVAMAAYHNITTVDGGSIGWKYRPYVNGVDQSSTFALADASPSTGYAAEYATGGTLALSAGDTLSVRWTDENNSLIRALANVHCFLEVRP